MITNKIESWAMKHPIRRWMLRYIEFPRFKKAMMKYAPDEAQKILEIGCGAGFTSELIYNAFKPQNMASIDLDPDMVVTAKKHNQNQLITFLEGNATQLNFDDNSFDAVFEFGIFHHIPNWQKSISEAYRVLKPGGTFLLEDLHIGSFSGIWPLRFLLRKLTDHPYDHMFTYGEFVAEMKKAGFKILEHVHKPWQLDHFFIVAQK